MTEFASLVQQHRNPFIVECFEFRVGVNINKFNINPEFSRQRDQCQLHVVTEMTIRTRDQRQLRQVILLSCRALPVP